MEILMIVLLVGILILLFTKNLESKLVNFERAIRDEISSNRNELAKSLKDFGDTSFAQIANLTQVNETKLERIRETLEQKLRHIQEDNERKLEQMRQTVDEKLHETLEKRLGDSFKIISERLEKVHAGLGEMQNLAIGVGDLKKVLTNVKTRGILGEIQLGNLLEQILTSDQYEKNVVTKIESREVVEFAIKLPGKGETIWLPVDAKFPKEDYEKLLNAQEAGDMKLAEEAIKCLEARIKTEAKKIRDKYINPPATTDFALMFLPTEGLYAEVLRRPGLFESIQREYKVVVTGPTTTAAILNSLQMGFQTLAIEKRASEVWRVLGAVKAEFGKFGELLDKTQKQLLTVANSIEDATKKTRTIEKKLKDVHELPAVESDPESAALPFANFIEEEVKD